jgi:hypothetical protein
MPNQFIEYRVRPVTRYIVTRYEQQRDGSGSTCGASDFKGEFDTHGTAYAVAYALAKEEHGRLGYPLGDMRIRYPEAPGMTTAVLERTGEPDAQCAG